MPVTTTPSLFDRIDDVGPNLSWVRGNQDLIVGWMKAHPHHVLRKQVERELGGGLKAIPHNYEEFVAAELAGHRFEGH